MKRVLFLCLTFFLLFLSWLPSALAQDCNILAPGSEAGFDQKGFCAPVTGQVTFFTFYTINPLPKSQVGVEVNWGDGKKIQYAVDDSLGLNGNGVYEYRVYNAEYIYEADRKNPKCSYPITVQAFVKRADGKNMICSSPQQTSTVIVWDKDNANGGSLLFEPQKYYVCPGSAVEVAFEDRSIWNCAPAGNNTHANWPSRTTQFVYGTSNTITGTVMVGGEAVGSTPLAGPLQVYEDNARGPAAPHNKTALIRIPADAQPGEKFEVTLNNWNICNPRAAGQAAVQEKAIIEVVAVPMAALTVKNTLDNEANAFCPNEKVKLFGSYLMEGNPELELQATDVRYDWEIVDVSSGAVLTFEDQQDVVLEKGFPSPGKQKILLHVSNKKVNTGQLCVNTTEQLIELIDAPTVQSKINGVSAREVDYCGDEAQAQEQWLTFAHTFKSNEDFTYTYHLYKRNSTSQQPDSSLSIISGAGLKQQAAMGEYSAAYSRPGQYRIQVVAQNKNTGCSTVEENRVTIYGKPQPNFTFKGSCVGQAIRFKDNSKASSVPGDKISSWEWDMNFSAQNKANGTFDADKTGKEAFDWTFDKPGSYEVALRVTNAAGCAAIKIHAVKIEEVPLAKLSSTYSGELICPGDTLRFFNESAALNSASVFPAGVQYSLMVSDGVATREHKFGEGADYLDYNQFFNPLQQEVTYSVWLQAKGNKPNTCAAVSKPIVVKVRYGAAVGYFTSPVYTPFEPNCSPNTIRFVTDNATRELQAESYKWTVMLDGKVQEEIIRKKGSGKFDTLDYTFVNKGFKYLDYQLILSAEKPGICVVPAVYTYRIHPNPAAQFKATKMQEDCETVAFEFKVNMPLGISDYQWEFSEIPMDDNDSKQKHDQFYATFKRPAFGEAAKEVRVRLQAKNFYGCQAEWTQDIVIEPSLMLAGIKPSFQLDALEKSLAEPGFRISNTTPDAAQWETQWDFGNGSSSREVHPELVKYEKSGEYTITMTITKGSCSKTFAIQVKVKDSKPEMSFKASEYSGCGPLAVSFTNHSRYADATTYFWDFGDGTGSSSAANPTYTYHKPGNYRVTLHAYNHTGSQIGTATTEEQIRVFSMPRADFVLRRETVYVPEEPVYVANYSERAAWYHWDFGDGTIYEGADQFEPVHYYQKPGLYDITLVVRSAEGCLDTLKIKQAVTAKGGGMVVVPNAFTPDISGPSGGYIDGAATNDVFFPVIQGGTVKYHLYVYNRWGELLFESTDMSKGWDGYYKGQLCRTDVYIYKLSAELVDGKRINQTGDIMLIR